MRTLLVIFFSSILFSNMCNATEREYIYKNNTANGGFGGPVLRASDIAGEILAMVGMRGAWLINHRYYLGGAVYMSLNDIENTTLRFNYAGLLMGMKFKPSKVTHYSADLLVAGAELRNQNNNSGSSYMHDGSSVDSMIVVEPSMSANINIGKYTEFDVSLSYRFISGSDKTTLSNSDLSGVSLSISMMFGAF